MLQDFCGGVFEKVKADIASAVMSNDRKDSLGPFRHKKGGPGRLFFYGYVLFLRFCRPVGEKALPLDAVMPLAIAA